MPSCQVHSLKVDISTAGKKTCVELHGKRQRISEAQFICIVNRIKLRAQASLIEFDAEARFAKFRLRSRRKGNQALKFIARIVNNAFAPQRSRHVGKQHGHERPMLHRPVPAYIK